MDLSCNGMRELEIKKIQKLYDCSINLWADENKLNSQSFTYIPKFPEVPHFKVILDKLKTNDHYTSKEYSEDLTKLSENILGTQPHKDDELLKMIIGIISKKIGKRIELANTPNADICKMKYRELISKTKAHSLDEFSHYCEDVMSKFYQKCCFPSDMCFPF